MTADRTAIEAVKAFWASIETLEDPAILLSIAEPATLGELAAQIDARPAEEVPLRGLVFAVKDNIDVAGLPTTAGCPSFAYEPSTSAPAVERLLAAGAIPVAKTNLDQFATGLVGVRSPYGTPINPRDAALVPGGSSSGSAVAVALGLVDFSLGTDTAGSGRVPAAFCSIVGLKPTVGRIPCTGVVPAVRSADVVSVFALLPRLAWEIVELMSGPDGVDALARAVDPAQGSVHTVGVVDPAWLAAVGADAAAVANYQLAVATLSTAGVATVPVDLTSFLAAGDLLYGGPFVAERTAAVGAFLADGPDGADPTVSAIVAGGADYSAVDAFRAFYEVAEHRLRAASALAEVDAFVVPTIPRSVTLAEVAADPVGPNVELGRFTTFANLLDLAALTLPVPGVAAAGFDPTASITLYGPAWSEPALVALAERLQGLAARPASVPDAWIRLVVAGAHLKGQPLESQLRGLGAVWEATTSTAACYRMYALPGGPPHKPALVHVGDGASLEVDTWLLPAAALGTFLTMVPAPLALGKVELADGTVETGFVAEGRAVDGATDISEFGGWRAYVAATTTV